jgi:spore maturation protein CgeB
MNAEFDIVILGLTVTSSWGNGHATTWRSLIKGLSSIGYRVLFLERDMPWYASNRDNSQPSGAITILYQDVEELRAKFESTVAQASLVIVGSFVPDGIEVGEWVNSVALGRTAFYDIDTPITLTKLDENEADYISRELICQYDAYLSFTGGPLLRRIEETYGSPMARALYCSVDIDLYRPRQSSFKWELGYLGTYSDDRQPSLEELLLTPARKLRDRQFVVAGAQYPSKIQWPQNVEHITHLPPAEHPKFYASQRFTLNVTREAMKRSGHSPSVRIFEAAACGVPIISDWWEGLNTVLQIGRQILVAEGADDVLRYLTDIAESERLQIAAAGRQRILSEHTPAIRALQIRRYLEEMNDNYSSGAARRNRRCWQAAGGQASWLASERNRQGAGEHIGGEAVTLHHSSDLHQPAGEGC